MNQTEERARWGAKERHLYRFSSNELLEVDLWPHPTARRMSPQSPEWNNCAPEDFNLWDVYQEIRNLKRSHEENRSIAQRIHKFMATLPNPVLDLTLQFQNRHWLLLQALAHCPQALDLGESNPALLFAIAHRDHLSASSSLERLVRLKQRDTCAELGFPGTNATVKILRKVTPRSLGLKTLTRLRALLTTRRHRKLLAHCPRINTGAIALLETRYEIPPTLLQEVGTTWEEDEEASTANCLKDILRMREQLDGPIHATSRQSLLAQHHELQNILSRLPNPEDRAPYPLPPIPGNQTIIPITNPIDLLREGHQQRHCVLRLQNQIRAGNYYVYKILTPQRATLGLKRDNNQWQVHEIKAKANQPVTPQTKKHAHKWLTTKREPEEKIGQHNQLPRQPR